jgi:malate dehydrogenase
MGVSTDGSYELEEGVIAGQPCQCVDGEYTIVEGLEISEFSRERIDASIDELRSERDSVDELGLI